MKNIKEWWVKVISSSVLWFVIPIFVLVVIPTLWYTQPLLNLNTDDITIYKFAITVLGVTVGIGTVVNSTRSAKIATESMKLTKEKDLREQSSHLVPVSPIGKFQYSVPNYKTMDKVNNLYSKNNGYHIFVKLIEDFQSNRYGFEEESEFKIKLMNVGKGTCINLDFSFRMLNLNDFDGYFYTNESDELRYLLPTQYSIRAHSDQSSKGENFIILHFNDLNIENNFSRFKELVRNPKEFSESIVHIKDSSLKQYIDVLEPQSNLSVSIPSDFIILCKQYLIASDSHANEILKNEGLETKNSSPVKPIGEITISYHDESLIRLGELQPDKKTVYKYTISPKDIRDLGSNFDLPFYLEINHLPK